ncbi:hypothetical protein TWF718_002079 [Orbilia javanica]|uniref:Uncharacterized protein n=1 Tax=Orbilia javanica TaxID=47235 RepID=A0AAN8MZV0_9PEZI
MSTPSTTPLFVLLLCIIIPLIIRQFLRRLSTATLLLSGKRQEINVRCQNHQGPSLECLLALSTIGPGLEEPGPISTSISQIEAEVLLSSLPSVLKKSLLAARVTTVGKGASEYKHLGKSMKHSPTLENSNDMCGTSRVLPPTVTNHPPSKCTHPNHIRHAPQGDEFELVSINDGLGRFDTIPMMGVLNQWEQDRLICPESVISCHTNNVLSTLAIQSSCYSYEQVLYGNIVACMLEIFEVHAPKMLRNKKKIGGSYYYNLCEMLREPDNQAAVATFMMTVSLGKRPEMLAAKNPWGECMKPSLLSLWSIFHDLIETSDEELDETIESWARTAKEWSLAMIYLKVAHRRLWQESPLYLTGADVYDSKDDSEKAQAYIQRCLQAGNDQQALACQSLALLRQEVLCIHRRLDAKLNDPKALKKMTPYDIDLLRLYTATLGQLCTTGNIVNALVAWRDQRHDGVKKVRALAVERKGRDLVMQELARVAENTGNEHEHSDSELSTVSRASSVSDASSRKSISSIETSSFGEEKLDTGAALATAPIVLISPDNMGPTCIWEGRTLL